MACSYPCYSEGRGAFTYEGLTLYAVALVQFYFDSDISKMEAVSKDAESTLCRKVPFDLDGVGGCAVESRGPVGDNGQNIGLGCRKHGFKPLIPDAELWVTIVNLFS